VRWLGRELGGLLRSLRYDVNRPVPLSRRRTEVLHPEYDAYRRPVRRRYLPVTGLVLAGALFVGVTYVGVSKGLAGLLSGRPGSVPPAAGSSPTPTFGTVPSVTEPRNGRTVPPASHRPNAVPGSPVPVAAPGCLCPVPPVPTPEASTVTPSHSPSPTPSPSVTPSPSPASSGTGAGQP
jgi:hypothetical protein